MEALLLEEWKKIHNRQKYKYLCFKDVNGEIIVPWNSNKITAANRIKEIETRMETQPGNVFILECKTSTSPKAKSDPFYIAKDKSLKDSPVTVEAVVIEDKPKKAVEANNVRSYDNVLELEVRCKQLELENKVLQDRIDQLEEELENVEAGLSDEPEANPTLDWLKATFETITPMVDKWFEQRDRKLALEAYQVMNGNGTAAPKQALSPEQQAAQQDPIVMATVAKIQEFIGSFEQEDPETCQQLVAFYNQAANFDHFYTLVQQYDPEIFNELIEEINGRSAAEAEA